MNIDNLLVDFDEMGFVPTTLCENPEEYAKEWKRQLVAAIERLKKENMLLEKMCELSKSFHDEKCAEFDSACYAIEKLQAENYQLRNKVKDANTAVKEFAEKLKEICLQRGEWDGDSDDINDEYFIVGRLCIEDIDELLKEYEK